MATSGNQGAIWSFKRGMAAFALIALVLAVAVPILKARLRRLMSQAEADMGMAPFTLSSACMRDLVNGIAQGIGRYRKLFLA
jgi:hypothetical protein